ncbi:MAG: tetratricopeptide repeat protein [Verrucomicrobia bacterium]|nr:tetratricopeptide repeat protein [Verrucomicrobiota bacterium]
MCKKIFLFFLFTWISSFASPHLNSLYHSLDPLSITQNLAFYELYPKSPEGALALKRAWSLLCGEGPISSSTLILPKIDLQAVISLITKQPSDPPVELSTEQMKIMDRISSSLNNRSLQGSTIWTEKEILELPPHEIDLGRALLIYQFEEDPEARKKILDYEASLDLMALQIRVRLPKNASAEEKISQINRFIFQEMGFRYPPHSLDAKHIDLYTFLPSVIDSRRGVCLGVSVLYLCLAQRLDLPLEIITPPGHIYLRYPSSDGILNIETTARGINLPSDVYLGVNTRSLQTRTLKEVIGLVFFNQASISLSNGDYKTTVKLYEKTRLYSPNDPFFTLYLGINYLFAGKKKEGKQLLNEVKSLTLDYAVSAETLPSDYLNGYIDIEGMKTIFMRVDENRSSIIEKQQLLQKTLKKYPKFRAGLLQLATTYLQLNKTAEALEILLEYDKLDPNDVTVEYYLSILCFQRLDYIKAWEFFRKALNLTENRKHNPKALISLQSQIRQVCPDPFFIK